MERRWNQNQRVEKRWNQISKGGKKVEYNIKGWERRWKYVISNVEKIDIRHRNRQRNRHSKTTMLGYQGYTTAVILIVIPNNHNPILIVTLGVSLTNIEWWDWVWGLQLGLRYIRDPELL